MMIQLLTPATAATKAVTFLTAGQKISQLANLSSELSQKSLLSFERPDTVRSNSSTTDSSSAFLLSPARTLTISYM